jgi:hypothetical protein
VGEVVEFEDGEADAAALAGDVADVVQEGDEVLAHGFDLVELVVDAEMAAEGEAKDVAVVALGGDQVGTADEGAVVDVGAVAVDEGLRGQGFVELA